jgi:hypothetical protein
VKKDTACGKQGHREAEHVFFSRVDISQRELMRSRWNPYHLEPADEGREEELREIIRGCHQNLGSEWDGGLDDPVSVFHVSDPNMFRRYYAICKLRALSGHPAYDRRQKSTVYSLFTPKRKRVPSM